MDLSSWGMIRQEESIMYHAIANNDVDPSGMRVFAQNIINYLAPDKDTKYKLQQYLNILYLYSREDRIKIRKQPTQVYTIDSDLKEAAWLIACCLEDVKIQ